MGSPQKRLALLGALTAVLLLSAAFAGAASTASTAAAKQSTATAAATIAKAGANTTKARATVTATKAVTAGTNLRVSDAAKRAARVRGHSRGPADAVFNGAITTGDPTQSPRLFRDGIPDTCAAPGTSGITGSGNYNYDVYEVVRTGSTGCVDVVVRHALHGYELHLLRCLQPDVQPGEHSRELAGRSRLEPEPDRELLVHPRHGRARLHQRARGDERRRMLRLHGQRVRRGSGWRTSATTAPAATSTSATTRRSLRPVRQRPPKRNRLERAHR